MRTNSMTRYAVCLSLIYLCVMSVNCGYQSKPVAGYDPLAEAEAARKKEEDRKRGVEEAKAAYSRIIPAYAELPQRTQLTNTPRIKGQLIILERDEPNTQFSLSPKTIISTTGSQQAPPAPETVTVALIVYRREPFGDFKTNEGKSLPGYRLNGEVTLIDRTIPAVIHRRTFRGPDPGMGVGNNQRAEGIRAGQTEIVGKRPDLDITGYLQSLPRDYTSAPPPPPPARKQ